MASGCFLDKNPNGLESFECSRSAWIYAYSSLYNNMTSLNYSFITLNYLPLWKRPLIPLFKLCPYCSFSVEHPSTPYLSRSFEFLVNVTSSWKPPLTTSSQDQNISPPHVPNLQCLSILEHCQIVLKLSSFCFPVPDRLKLGQGLYL